MQIIRVATICMEIQKYKNMFPMISETNVIPFILGPQGSRGGATLDCSIQVPSRRSLILGVYTAPSYRKTHWKN